MNMIDYRKDLSIFSVDEWEKLLEISANFEKAVHWFNNASNNEYSRADSELRSSAYYLWYSPFSHCVGFRALDYDMLNLYDIYKKVFDILKEENSLTVDKFHDWIYENKDTLDYRYNILKSHME